MKIKRPDVLLTEFWQPLLFWTIGLLVLLSSLFYRLASLTPGFSRPEMSAQLNASSWRLLLNNPLNAPYKLINLGISQFGHIEPFYARAVSAIFGLVTVLLFYYIVSRWHDRKTAILGSLMFVTSAWFLHSARLAVPNITETLLLGTLAYGHWIRQTKRSNMVGVLGVLIAVCLIYVPGLIWFVLLGCLWQRKRVSEHLKDTKLSIPLVVVLGIGLLLPLAVAIAKQPALAKSLVGLPVHGFPAPYDYLRHVLNVPFQIFFHGPKNPVIWLGQLPLLDVFSTTMFILGAYTYYQRRKLDRAKLLAGSLIIGTLLVGLTGSLSIAVLLPIIYLIIAAGIGFLLNQWLAVYPHNPLARSIGIGLVGLVVIMSCAYNLRQYFVAWPGAPATKQAYQRRL